LDVEGTMILTAWVVLNLPGLLKRDGKNDLLRNGWKGPASMRALGREGNHQRVTHLEHEIESVMGKDAAGEGAW